MLTKLSSKGQTVIPAAIREQARLRPGDELEVGFADGLVILRKKMPLTPSSVRGLLLAGRKLPVMTEDDVESVASAIRRIRSRARV